MSGIEEDPTLLARSLPRRIEPDRDLWPDIQARLGTSPAETGARRWRAAALAAGLLLAVGVGFWLGSAGSDTDPVAGAGMAANQPPPGAARAVPAGVQFTRAELVNQLERQIAVLPPESQAVVVRNLATINTALDQIDAALASDSGGDGATSQRLLMAMYADQLALLSSMNNLLYRTHPETAL